MPLFADAESIARGILIASAVSAVATVVLAVLTGAYVLLTGKVVRSQTDPYVITYMQPVRSGKVGIAIENVGGGLAQDIRFDRHPHMERDIWDKFINAPRSGGPPMRATAIGTGIPALPPRGKRVVYWGMWSDFRDDFSRGLLVVCRFRRGDSSEAKPTKCILEVISLDGAITEI